MTADVRMRGFGKRASVGEAQALIAERTRPLGVERVPFRAALDRILAEDLRATANVPAHPRSAMDGYGVRAADAGRQVVVIGRVLAAETWPGRLEEGQALMLMTGAKIPDGVELVVMVEDAKADGDRVTLKSGPAGQHIHATGSDLRAGEVVLHKGRRLRPADVSMLATLGALEVPVMKRPRVRIVPSGSELIPPGKRPSGSEIVESNAYLLEALVRRDGGVPEVHPIISDDRSVLEAVLRAPGADLIVITGGSSVGVEDFAPVIVRALGELPIHGISVKPASPTGIGFIGETPVLLAPGYPVASYVAWDLFGRLMVEHLGGAPTRWPYTRIKARLGAAFEKPAARVELVRVTLTDSVPPMAHPIPGGAALLSTVTKADGFWLAGEGVSKEAIGSEIEIDLY